MRPLSWCPSAFSLSSSFFFCLSVCLSVRLSPCLSVCRRRQDLSRPVRFPDDAPLSQVVSLQESWPRVQAWLDGPLRQAVGGALAAYCKPIRCVLLFSLIRRAALINTKFLMYSCLIPISFESLRSCGLNGDCNSLYALESWALFPQFDGLANAM